MADLRKLGKGMTGALAQAKQLAAAEREANLQKFLAQSKVQQRLYHGTTATEGGKGQEAIRRLKPSKEGALGSGVYMTPKADFAGSYAGYSPSGVHQTDSGVPSTGGNVLPVHAQIRNPLIIDGSHGDPMIEALVKLGMDEASASKMVEKAYEDKGYIGKQVQTRAQAAGYDGLMQYRDGDLSEVVSYNPNAVKSATGNEGTYDIYNPDLSKADGGKIVNRTMGALAQAKSMAKALKVKPPSDNIATVREANFQYPKTIGNQTVKIGELNGGVRMSDPVERKRVEALAQKMASPEGYISRIIVDHNNDVIEGQHRLEALRQLGIEDVPVYKIEDLSATMPVDAMKSALSSVGPIHPDHAGQLVHQALENIAEYGVAGARDFDYGRHQKHYDAALNAAERGDADIAKADGGPIRVQPKKPKDSAQGFMDKLQQAAQDAQKIPTSPLGFMLNTGYAGYKHFTGKDPLADLQRELDRKLNPKLDTGSEFVQQFEKLAEGGGVKHMADAGKVTRGITGALTKAKEMAQAKKAASTDKPGVQYADPLKPANMRMSEALGNAGAEGKTLNFTEADRSRVFGPNRGGVGFSGLQHYSLPHKKANTVWGFGNRATAEKKIRQNDPENSLFTTFVGSPDQHKSNSVVIGDAMQNFQDAVKKGVVPPEQIMLMNKRLNELADPKTGAKIFEEGFDLTDPSALNVANTFSRRAAVGDVMLGLGVKGPMARLDFKKQYPNTKFTDASKIEDILKRETDPDLVDAGTYDVGNRLFVMDGKIIERPDLNEAFPIQVTGTDLGMKYELVPPQTAMRDFYKAREGRKNKRGEPSPVTYYDLARAEPSQFVDEDYLTFLQKEGHKKGGAVNRTESPEDMARFHKRFAMHKALGGRVSSRPVKKMAEGGRASIFDAPAKRMSKGGSSDEPTTREIAEALGELAMDQSKKEYESYKKPRAATDIGNRGILAPALGLPVDMINMGLGGVDALTGLMGKPTRLSSEKPFAGSEHIKDLMNKYGVTSGEDRPMTETALSLFSPTGMIKGAQGMTKGAVKAAGAMRKPMSGLGAMREKTN